jgi:DNA-binding transcriptional ArsR family regulator
MNNAKEERILKSLANRRRIAIVRYLKKNKTATVGDVAEAIKLSFKATSKHLAILATTDILTREQQSVSMLYQISPDMPSLARTVIVAL